MKSRFAGLVTAAACAMLCIVLAGAQGPAPNQAGKASEGWFTSTQLAEGIWCISDNGSDNIYLVEGRDRALLIDTGLGVARLREYVETLTRKPLLVVNTHGHPDHAGGNFQFKTVYAHPADFEAIKRVGSRESRERAARNMAKGAPRADMIPLEETGNAPQPELIPIRGGHIFDLGGRRLEVIEAPGHTPGEIVLLDPSSRALFTGDNSNALVWLFLSESLPLETYLTTLRNLQKRSHEFDTIYPGHGSPLPKTFLEEQIACVQGILDGSIQGTPQKYFAGEAMVGRFKNAAVAYDPAKLRAKR